MPSIQFIGSNRDSYPIYPSGFVDSYSFFEQISPWRALVPLNDQFTFSTEREKVLLIAV